MARSRASSSARGYGTPHRQFRAIMKPSYVPGVTRCVRCGRPISDPWPLVHLDHTDDRTGYLGLSHQACNAAAGARKTNAQRRLQRRGQPRW